MTFLAPLILSIAGIALSALFAGFENGMVSIRKARLDHAVEQGSWTAKLIQRMLNNPSSMLATVLLGTNLAHCLTAVYFGKLFHADTIWEQVAAVGVLTLVMLVFAEITPKIWFRQKPYERCRTMVLPVYAFFLFPPCWLFIKLLTVLVNLMNKMLNKGKGDVILLRDDFRTMLRESEEDGLLATADRLILENSLDFNKQTAADLMVQRSNANALSIDATLAEAVALTTETDHSRLPLFDSDNGDNWAGMFSVYDAIYQVERRHWETTKVSDYVRPLISVDSTTGVADILQQSRLNQTPLLVVTDSNGKHIGLITAEDVVRPLFGKIRV
jgi:putative hemolysin